MRGKHGATLGEAPRGGHSPKVLGLIGESGAASVEFPCRTAPAMLRGMKTQIAIWLIVASYLLAALAQDGPLQCWLVALAPFVVLGVGFALHVGDQAQAGAAWDD